MTPAEQTAQAAGDSNPMARYVETYVPYQLSGARKRPAVVNWSAIGSVSAEQARQMAAALLAAADEVDRMNAQEPQQ